MKAAYMKRFRYSENLIEISERFLILRLDHQLCHIIKYENGLKGIQQGL